MRKLNCPPNAEVLGQNFRAFTDNLESQTTRPIMEKYGIPNPAPDQWYPLSMLLGVLNELARKPEVSAGLVAIGLKIGEIVPMPPGRPNPTLEQVLRGWNGIYQMLHRNGDVGTIAVEKVGPQHFKLTFTDVYPDDFSYGIIYGYGRRFLPLGTQFTVYYDPNVTPRDRGGDGNTTVIHITWE